MTLFNINPNALFLTLFVIVVLLCVVFLFSAIVVAYKRKTNAAFWEVIRSMVADPVFDAAFVLAFSSMAVNQFEAMFATIATFVGYKLVATEVAVVNNGDYRFEFFESSFLNKWAAAFISTRSLMILFGIGILALATYKGLYTGPVMERMVELIGAWGAANGIPLLTMLKDKDLSFLTPTAKPVPIVQQQYQPPAQVQPAAQAPAPTAPAVESPKYANRPAYIPFSTKVMDGLFEGYFEAHPLLDSALGKNDASNVDIVAKGQIPWYPQQLLDFANWRLSKYYAEFKQDFGFEFSESENHWGDKNLVGDCTATSEATFMLKMPQAKKQIYQEMLAELSKYENFAISWGRLGDAYIESVLAQGKYDYPTAYWGIAVMPQNFV